MVTCNHETKTKALIERLGNREVLLQLPPGSVTACAGCQWPLCCAGCQDSPQHRQECLLLSQAGVVPALDSEHSNQWIYTAVALLRVLLLKRDQPDQWEKVEQLMDHWEERATNTEVVKAMKIMFAFFSKKLSLDWISLEDVQHVFGVLQTNSVSLISRQGRTFYPVVSLLSHSCLPNLEPVSNPAATIKLRAKTRIEAGQQLTMRYTSFLSPVWRRRQEIKTEWMFDCDCVRCIDNSDLNTFLSALSCHCGGFYSNKLDNKHGFTFSCSGCQQARDFTEKFERFQQIEERLSSCSLTREELRSFLAEIDADEQIHDQFYLKVKANMKYCEMFQDSSDRETLEEVMSRVKTVLNLIRDIDQGCSKVTGKYVLVLAEVQEKLLTLRRKEDPAVQPSQLRKEVADLIKSKMIANKMLGQHYTTPKHKPATTSSKEGT